MRSTSSTRDSRAFWRCLLAIPERSSPRCASKSTRKWPTGARKGRRRLCPACSSSTKSADCCSNHAPRRQPRPALTPARCRRSTCLISNASRTSTAPSSRISRLCSLWPPTAASPRSAARRTGAARESQRHRAPPRRASRRPRVSFNFERKWSSYGRAGTSRRTGDR